MLICWSQNQAPIPCLPHFLKAPIKEIVSITVILASVFFGQKKAKYLSKQDKIVI